MHQVGQGLRTVSLPVSNSRQVALIRSFSLYYQYSDKRLPFCTSNVHGLLHLAQYIRESGPLHCFWNYITERACGFVARLVTSRLHPYGTLNQAIKRRAQLMQVINKYDLVNTVDFFHDNSRDDAETSRFEWKIPGCEHTCLVVALALTHALIVDDATVLRAPVTRNFIPDRSLREKVAKYFVNVFTLKSWTQIMRYLPKVMVRYGKIRRIGGDGIRGSIVGTREDKLRDSSHVRVS